MDRRTLLKAVPAAGAVSFAGTRTAHAQQTAAWRTFETTARIELAPSKIASRVWVPLPLSQDTDWFQTLGNSWRGNAESAEIIIDPIYRVSMVAATFKADEPKPVIEISSRFQTRDRKVELRPGAGMQSSAEELAIYLKPTALMPTDGIVRETALKVTGGAKTDVDKCRALYNWVVDNTFRNAKTRGCGVGDIKTMLETGNLNGKCADLNALFVGLARASGVPARDVYGVRVAASPMGYASMGRADGNITRAQHCRAEFYAQGIGWFPVDPADVRKVVLEEKPNLQMGDDLVQRARTFLWGSWEGNWLAYNYGHDVRLPGSSKAPVEFLMYPQAETAQGRLDSLDPDSFKYAISARELKA